MMQIRLSLLFFLLSNLILPFRITAIQNGGQPLLIIIGGDYLNITPTINAAIANAKNGKVNILVLPIAMASDFNTISESERGALIEKANTIRSKIEQGCQLNAPPNLTCNTTLAQILTRDDAHSKAALDYFIAPLSEIFILDGDPTIAMNVIGGTQVELALDRAYQAGVVIAGTGAGGIIQSTSMIGGYNPGFSAENSMEFNAPDLWSSAEKHGLLFGMQTAILDVDFFKNNHFGRLLNAITMPDAPPIGIGFDTNTAAQLAGGVQIERVTGNGTVTILDAATYHSNTSTRFIGSRHLLSIRNVIVNMLAPGNYSYDLRSNHSNLASPNHFVQRTYEALRLPSGAGALWIAGDLQQSPSEAQILNRFIKASGSTRANILIVACGYPSDALAQRNAVEYAQALKANSRIYTIRQGGMLPEVLSGYTGILLIGGEQSLIEPATLEPIKNAWLSGTPLLAINAAAGVVGEFYIVDPSRDNRIGLIKDSAVSSDKELNIQPGLGLLNISIQPSVMDNNLWVSYLSLAYNHPELIDIGLNDLTAVEIGSNGAYALGENVVFVLDFRPASLAIGNNNAYVIANGILDSFGPGESVEPQVADISTNLERQSTPNLSTSTVTLFPSSTPSPTRTPRPSSTPTLEPTPTRRIKPSSTPLIIPPPSDPGTRSMMVAFGVLIALLIATGVWINRKRIS